jgi:GWxTD domain-containing protein
MTCFARSLAALFILIALVIPGLAQTQSNNPEQKQQRVRPEPKKAYANWIKDVELILTDAERDAWNKLDNDDEREQFIQIFWKSRDTDPDTEENEFKDEYYERLAYVDVHFSSGKPGRFTDRGRIYVKFGKPDSVESHVAGGMYQRASYEGGGSTSTYPFEKWYYRYIPKIASGIELEFVDPTGSGEFRLARNPDEKDALIHVPGAGPTLCEGLGLCSRGDRIAGLNSFGTTNYTRAQDSPFEVMRLISDLERVIPVDPRFPGTTTETPKIDDNPLNFETQINYFRQSDGNVLAAFTVQADNKDLSFENSGGLLVARLNIYGRITTIADQRIGKFEDSVSTTATAEELSQVRGRKAAYGKAVILRPGHYRVDLMVRDVQSGAAGIQHIGFKVPQFPEDRLSVSSVVLASKLENMAGQAAGGQFVIGTTKVIPNLSRVFRRGQPIGVYFQIYNAAIDQTTLKPAADVEYVLMMNGKELSKYTEDWRTINDAGQRLTMTRLIDSQGLAPGSYQIQIRVFDQITSERLTTQASFTIEP